MKAITAVAPHGTRVTAVPRERRTDPVAQQPQPGADVEGLAQRAGIGDQPADHGEPGASGSSSASAVTRPPTTATTGQLIGGAARSSVRRRGLPRAGSPWRAARGPASLRRGDSSRGHSLSMLDPADCARIGGTRQPRVKSWVVVGVRDPANARSAVQAIGGFPNLARSSSPWSTRSPRSYRPRRAFIEPDPEPEPPPPAARPERRTQWSHAAAAIWTRTPRSRSTATRSATHRR